MEMNVQIKRVISIIAVVLSCLMLLVVLFGAAYTVDETEQAVVFTFEEPTGVFNAGLHFKIPIIQSVIKLPTKKTLMLTIGYWTDKDGQTHSIDDESLMLTGDDNLVRVDYTVEYQILDPIKYLYGSESAETVLRGLVQTAGRSYIGSSAMDYVMTEGRSDIQDQIKSEVDKRLGVIDVGLYVKNIKVQDVDPPDANEGGPVDNSFKGVTDAMNDRLTEINNAEKNAISIKAAADSEADRIRKEADAYYNQQVSLAKATQERYSALWGEYSKNPAVVYRRMYLETLEEVLREKRIYIIGSGDNTVIPIENLMKSVGNQ